MIIRDRPDMIQLLTAMRGSIVPQILPPLLSVTVLAALIVAADRLTHWVPHLDSTAYTVFGIGLSLFLGFRNNAAYDRWWEARKLWGGLLADMRSLAREADTFIPDRAAHHRVLRLALDYLHAHRINLRRLPFPDHGPAAVFRDAPHPPCAALDALSAEVVRGHREGMIDGFGARALTTRLSQMAGQQAGCERIANSPLPYVYSLLIYRTTWLYCLLLPLALVQTTGWLTPLFTAVVAYMFLGLAEVTEELSHPFGQSQNGLPLDAICRAAEISLAPHLGEKAPEPLAPVGHYLS
ncbi:bestrophin family protein [Pseudogemmobacter humi]|uniref:Bestrophin, RFP-TM, chloride channel n=1 Tax=Pseudogemmobacter humi TaxID=2483812 RepID=A0A3P5X7N6_9RHOB|nr:bestrophin family ion channel [Pseudogemmobacter humi]VDC24347.1 Bestrophin, RFP-TM, chloride channel [Pseudogemmobacter humi]